MIAKYYQDQDFEILMGEETNDNFHEIVGLYDPEWTEQTRKEYEEWKNEH